jgi:hypothetical protein
VTGTGTEESPYQSIKYALSQITPSSSDRYAMKVATGTYVEDNPITWKPSAYIQGDFKHNPMINPSNNSANLIEFPAGYTTCDFGDLTFTAPTNGAVFYAGAGAYPIVGLHDCLFIGEGAGSSAFYCEEDGSGYHIRKGYTYGTWGTFANMVGGNYYETSFWIHEGTTIARYLYVSGAQSNYIYDLKNDSTAVTLLAQVNNASATLEINRLQSVTIEQLLQQDDGTTIVRGGSCNGQIVADAGSVTLDGFNSTVEGYVVTGSPDDLSITGCHLTSTGGNDTIYLTVNPTTSNISGNTFTGDGDWNIAASTAIGLALSNNVMDDGCNSNVVNSNTPNLHEVPQTYKAIQTAIDAASSGDRIVVKGGVTYDEQLSISNKTIVFYSVNGQAALTGSTENPTVAITKTTAGWQVVDFHDFYFEAVEGSQPIVQASVSDSALGMNVGFYGCDLYLGDENADENAVEITGTTSQPVLATFSDCEFSGGAFEDDFIHVTANKSDASVTLKNSTVGNINLDGGILSGNNSWFYSIDFDTNSTYTSAPSTLQSCTVLSAINVTAASAPLRMYNCTVPVKRVTVGDATPDLRGSYVWEVPTAASSWNITGFDNGVVGQTYTFIGRYVAADGRASIQDSPAGTTLFTEGDWLATANDTLMLYCPSANVYYELGRSNN